MEKEKHKQKLVRRTRTTNKPPLINGKNKLSNKDPNYSQTGTMKSKGHHNFNPDGSHNFTDRMDQVLS